MSDEKPHMKKDLEIEFIQGPPPKPIIPFNDMRIFFMIVNPDMLEPDHYYLVFSSGMLGHNKEYDAYYIVKYLGTDADGGIRVSQIFSRNRYDGWAKIADYMSGSKFYKEEKTYKANTVFRKDVRYSRADAENINYIFRDLGRRQSDFNSEMPAEEVEDIIEEIIARKIAVKAASTAATATATSDAKETKGGSKRKRNKGRKNKRTMKKKGKRRKYK